MLTDAEHWRDHFSAYYVPQVACFLGRAGEPWEQTTQSATFQYSMWKFERRSLSLMLSCMRLDQGQFVKLVSDLPPGDLLVTFILCYNIYILMYISIWSWLEVGSWIGIARMQRRMLYEYHRQVHQDLVRFQDQTPETYKWWEIWASWSKNLDKATSAMF